MVDYDLREIMKKVNWKHFLLYFFVIAAIYYLTKSFWMSLGIILLLFVVDNFLKEYDKKRAKRKDEKS